MPGEEGHVLTDDEQQEMLPQPKRRDWQLNSSKIRRAYLAFYRDNQDEPTYEDLVKITGLSRPTVVRHMQNMNFTEVFQDQREKMTVFAPNVFMAIYNSAMKGNARSQEMMLQVMFGWATPKVFEQVVETQETNEEELVKFDQGIELLLAMRERQKEKYGDRTAPDTTS